MKKIFMLSTLLLISTTILIADEHLDGKELYLKANCQKCHNVGKEFDAKERKTKNLLELKSWVSSCANYFNVDWFPNEEKKVINYINKVYYKF